MKKYKNYDFKIETGLNLKIDIIDIHQRPIISNMLLSDITIFTPFAKTFDEKRRNYFLPLVEVIEKRNSFDVDHFYFYLISHGSDFNFRNFSIEKIVESIFEKLLKIDEMYQLEKL